MSLATSVRRGVLVTTVAAASSFGAACGVSQQQEAQIGAQYSAEINQQLPIVRDASLVSYINTLGDQIARGTQRPFEYSFYIVNTSEVNAFALPGGYVYVNRGLIERTDNLSELAGVLAHEISHVELRHSAEMLERQQNANIGLTLAYILMGRNPSGVEEAAINIGGSAIFANYGRTAETEADETGVRLMVQAGIHPNGMVSFFNELLQERKRTPSALEQWFSTHPITEDRIANTSAAVRSIPSSRLNNLTVDTQAFQQFRSRMRSYARQ